MSNIAEILIENDLYTAAGSRQELLDLVGRTARSVQLEVLRGADSFDDLEAVQKTCFGIWFEKDLVRHLGLPSKISRAKNPHQLLLDTKIAGFHIDIKTTLGRNWMIPNECVGHWCVLLRMDWRKATYDFGVVQADLTRLNRGVNRDQKRTLSKTGRRDIHWIAQAQPY